MMKSILLVVCFFAACSVVMAKPNPEQAWQGDCYWLCGSSGDFISCENNEIAAGTCGSGGVFSNCKDRTGCRGLLGNIHAIKCCTVV